MAWTVTKCSLGDRHAPKGCRGEHRYLVRWREPTTHRIVSRGFGRWEDARSHKAQVESQIDRGDYIQASDRNVPLGVYIAAILAADTELRDGTIDFYQGTLRTHIIGTQLGQTPVGKLTVAALRDFWGLLNIGSGARRNVYQLLSKAFNQLYREGIHPVPLHRKANLKSPSRTRRREIQPLDVATVELLAEHAGTAINALAIRIAAYAGLRAGEVGGLRVQDVDFRRRTFSIRQATWRVNGQRGIGPAKTPQSQRTITVPDFLIEGVRECLADNPPASDGRILHRRDRPVEHIILNKVSHDAARRAGLPPVTFHSLRHTCAALLIKSGAQPKQIQAYMGHSSIGVTMDVYGHLFDATGEDLAVRMTALRVEALSK